MKEFCSLSLHCNQLRLLLLPALLWDDKKKNPSRHYWNLKLLSVQKFSLHSQKLSFYFAFPSKSRQLHVAELDFHRNSRCFKSKMENPLCWVKCLVSTKNNKFFTINRCSHSGKMHLNSFSHWSCLGLMNEGRRQWKVFSCRDEFQQAAVLSSPHQTSAFYCELICLEFDS